MPNIERRMVMLSPIPTTFTARDAEDGARYIEGYFARYDDTYTITPDMSESIVPGAFNNLAGGDIRALVNHNTDLVLGRNIARTLELRDDPTGLWGRIRINPNDTDATNCLARVERGDVTQCSIGMEIVREETELRADGGTHWTIREAVLWEVSVCTFPAYEKTHVDARSADRAEWQRRELEAWKINMRGRLKHGD